MLDKDEAVRRLQEFATAVAEWQRQADRGRDMKTARNDARLAVEILFKALTGEVATGDQINSILYEVSYG